MADDTKPTEPVEATPTKPEPLDATAQMELALKKVTRLAKTTTALVAAIVVLVAAVVGGYYHIEGIVQDHRKQTDKTRETVKDAAGDLATDVEMLAAQLQQTQDDLAGLREYIANLTLPKGQGQSPPPVPTAVRVKSPPKGTAAPPIPATTSEPVLPAPAPPEVAQPEPIELQSQKMNERF